LIIKLIRFFFRKEEYLKRMLPNEKKQEAKKKELEIEKQKE
jgi:hypothetical protein